MKLLKRLVTEESGQGLVEYVLIIALIAVICLGGLRLLGNNANNRLDQVAGQV